jgi:DNA (cytosine-5)-methyltransferase 1
MNKPPYQIPTMAEVRAVPWNGYTVASTFSGCGGSCTGYRMAGFRVVWANEFVPIAQESYKANADPHCHLDGRDIKLVTAADIFKATGLKEGELDLFDGSPPRQAFSTAGQREKGWGKGKHYEHGAVQCNETLFDQYIRLLRGLKPRVFVAENVSGLIKGKAKGFFLDILRDLKASGYRVRCQVLDAQWLGVPQTRQRTIFIGVRDDLGIEAAFPVPLQYRYSVRDALPEIGVIQCPGHGYFPGAENSGDKPSQSITTLASKFTVQSGARPKTFKDADAPAPAPAIVAGRTCAIRTEPRFVHSTGFNAGKHHSMDNLAPVIMADGIGGGNTSQTQIKTHDGQRKLTIAEVKRLCAFPDDFVLCGSYAQQWERLGNSVPPLMMRAIATVVRDEVLGKMTPPTPKPAPTRKPKCASARPR